jgi:hypothetical protein
MIFAAIIVIALVGVIILMDAVTDGEVVGYIMRWWDRNT